MPPVLVTRRNVQEALSEILDTNGHACDTETYGSHFTRFHWLPPPGVFSFQVSTQDKDFYFDFHHSEDKLQIEHKLELYERYLGDPNRLTIWHNAPFDLNQIRAEGGNIAGPVYCTRAMARVANNLEDSKMSLDGLAEKYLGANKLDLKTWLNENGAVDNFKMPTGREFDYYHFEKAPLDLLVEYGCRDTRLTLQLYNWQQKRFAEIQEIYEKHKIKKRVLDVVENEMELTKVIADMDFNGVRVDLDYCKEAFEFEKSKYAEFEKQLDELAAPHVPDKIDWLSPKQLKTLFDAMKLPYSYTEKGNATFDKEALEESETELAATILKYRFHYKRAHTYFENYINMCDDNGFIHCSAQQGGTGPGRMSYWTPNLQNVPKRTDKEDPRYDSRYKVRSCFIPEEGGFFADLDYKAAEYHLMFDYAEEEGIIRQVKEEGKDVHIATKEELGIDSRDDAKNMGFGLIYGMGKAALARKLKTNITRANALRNRYFQKMPRATKFIYGVRDVAKERGFLVSWLGRMLTIPPNESYKGPNWLIQGGIGDQTKKAMVAIKKHNDEYKLRSRMVVQVHDSLLCWIAFGEEEHILRYRNIMETQYPYKMLPQMTDANYSSKCWGTLSSEMPQSA